MEKTLVAATGNAHKLQEMREILSGYRILSEKEAGFFSEVEETGKTFTENAAIKARAVCKATGLAALADDSGLCVTALHGMPGVHSARFFELYATDEERALITGEKKNRRLLKKRMEGVAEREAYFACAVALAFPDGRLLTAEGRVYGTLLNDFCGENGFGYDSLFYSTELKKSFGEATEKEKNSVSHRARALFELEKLL